MCYILRIQQYPVNTTYNKFKAWVGQIIYEYRYLNLLSYIPKFHVPFIITKVILVGAGWWVLVGEVQVGGLRGPD